MGGGGQTGQGQGLEGLAGHGGALGFIWSTLEGSEQGSDMA